MSEVPNVVLLAILASKMILVINILQNLANMVVRVTTLTALLNARPVRQTQTVMLLRFLAVMAAHPQTLAVNVQSAKQTPTAMFLRFLAVVWDVRRLTLAVNAQSVTLILVPE